MSSHIKKIEILSNRISLLSFPDEFHLPREWIRTLIRGMQYAVPPVFAKAIGLALRVAAGDLKAKEN